MKEILQLKDAWLDTRFQHRKKLIVAMYSELGLPKAMSEMILENMFNKVNAKNLKRLQQKLKQDDFYAKANQWGCILPSNVPDPIVTTLIRAALCDAKLYLKFSRQQRLLADVLLKGCCAVTPVYKRLIQESTTHTRSFLKNYKEYNGVIAYGNNATLEAIRSSLPKDMRWKAYGHRISIAVIFGAQQKLSEMKRIAERCARDIWLYDQRGCLSPLCVYIEGNATLYKEGLQLAFEQHHKRYGKTKRPYVMQVERRLRLYEAQAQALKKTKQTYVESHGLVVQMKSFNKAQDIFRDSKPFHQVLQGIALTGDAKSKACIKKLFSPTSATLFSPLGNLQNPPLDWNL